MESKPATFYTDRSAAEADDRCGMEFWLNRKEGGTGIVPKRKGLALWIGSQIHEDLEALATMEDLSAAALRACARDILADLRDEDTFNTVNMELLYRRLGWIVAWGLFIEPKIRDQFENVGLEEEFVLERGDLWVGIKPDRLLRHKQGGWLKYLEYKSTVSSSYKWMASWQYAIQLHLSLLGINEEIAPERVKFAQVVGLMKGYKSQTDGRLVHPYVWAYYNDKTNEWSHEYKQGMNWKPMPVWEYPGGIVDWVLKCGEQCAMMQFPHTHPIFLDKRIAEEWLSRRLHREKEILRVEKACQNDTLLRGDYFPRRTSKCRPPFGDPCVYLPLCWNAENAAAPELHPDFEPRKPHHDVEYLIENWED